MHIYIYIYNAAKILSHRLQLLLEAQLRMMPDTPQDKIMAS